MADTPKKPKASSTPRKAATRKSDAPKKTGMAEVITMPSPTAAPTHEQIADLARKYWAERGYVDGHQEEDWLRAEQELRSKAS
jgi:hypothetical protein